VLITTPDYLLPFDPLTTTNRDAYLCGTVTRKRPITTEVLPGSDFTTTMRVCHMDMSSFQYRGIFSASMHYIPPIGASKRPTSFSLILYHGHLSKPLLKLISSASHHYTVSLSTRCGCLMRVRPAAPICRASTTGPSLKITPVQRSQSLLSGVSNHV